MPVSRLTRRKIRAAKSRRIRTDWKGSNPPTHFPSGEMIPAKLRKGLKREFFKVKKKRK